MNGRLSGLLVASALSLALASCSGGGGPASANVGCGDGQQGLCLTKCNLGCSVTGCNISEIAVNQRLIFDFNFEINPDTVNSNTIKMRTAEGNEPVGNFVVQGATVIFFPEARAIGSQTFFGFELNKEYTLSIPTKEESLEVVTSMSGDTLAQGFNCRLKVSRGVVDFDRKAPSASLVIPSGKTCESRDTHVLIEFSEIVDPATLLGSATTAGVRFGLAQFDANGDCADKSVAIAGSRTVSVNPATQRTSMLFRPAFRLPPSFCVRINVTDKVRDLSGKRAKPVTFTFKTCSDNIPERELTDDFSKTKERDDERNGAKWTKGLATPSPVGGSGRLGDFGARFGGKDTETTDKDGRRIFEWNTDNTVVPGIRTLSGEDEKVANGVYEFTSFILKDTEHVRFVGTKMPIIKVTGKMDIQGTLSISAPNAVKLEGSGGKPGKIGQPGQPAAIGGSKGGRGADSPHKTGTKNINGSVGEDVKVPTGHPLASSLKDTGGKPSIAHPKSGLDKDINYSAYDKTICQQATGGGGGGGMLTVGGKGRVVDNKRGLSIYPPQPADFGPGSIGGKALPWSTLFSRSEASSFLYLIGGSGGGGGGTHAHGAFKSTSQAIEWSPGSGGAGGGGPMHLKVGGDLIVSARGKLLARGGDGQRYPFDEKNFTNPAPGGGGGGGTLLLQVGGLPDFRGLVDARGGQEGWLDGYGGPQSFQLRIDSYSGKGGDGFIRYESNPPVDHKSLTIQPPSTANTVGKIHTSDEDKKSLLATTWKDTGLFFPPKFVRVEVLAVINGQDVLFSDDPKKSSRTPDKNSPVEFLIQAAQLDPDTKVPIPESISKWISGAVDPLNKSGGNGYRYMVRFNKTGLNTLAIKWVKVVIRG